MKTAEIEIEEQKSSSRQPYLINIRQYALKLEVFFEVTWE
ncbi:unnamed protein product [Paramecium octaurelia]|uniref:Uncharacterized protein n=1 Tax=Paramecium octaurelia TaxID=43137 RepID=A0A8S1TF32_PAROT|nr:unnamed protein product [Paramecium octaurelia]